MPRTATCAVAWGDTGNRQTLGTQIRRDNSERGCFYNIYSCRTKPGGDFVEVLTVFAGTSTYFGSCGAVVK